MSKCFATNKMKILRNKSTTATALILGLTIAVAFLICLPAVYAVDIPSYPFLTVAPNPVGVGQTVTVTMWLSAVPPTAAGSGGDRWHGFTLTITKPDTNTQTMGPYTADPVASYYLFYTPDSAGTYYFQFSFPGQRITGIDSLTGLPVDNYYKPSTSPKVSLTVQQAPIEAYPDWPLPGPNEYWERPISDENRNWWSISGNWLQGWYNISGRFNPYTKAPNTAHIVWKKPILFGGLIGGEFGSRGYYTGMSYESTWDPPVIMEGRLYYHQRLGGSSFQGLACVDLRTGEQLWFKNGTTITLGQIYDYESPNQHGAIPYLWGASGSTWSMYDAVTGDWILNLANAAVTIGPFTGTSIEYSPAGDMLAYILGNSWLAMWNSSRISGMIPASSGPDAWSWRPPHGATLDWRTGIQWNVTIPDVPGQIVQRITPDVIIASVILNATLNTYMHMGYSTKTGQRLWAQTRTNLPVGFTTTGLNIPLHGFATGIGPAGEGVYTLFTMATMEWWGYDIYTGAQLWGPTEPYTNAWGMYAWGLGDPAQIAYGKLYAATFDGMVHCYDLKTGTHLWDYSTGSSGFETPYGTWPFTGGITIADGKIYAATSEHSPNVPLWRGERLHVIDAQTGKGIWSILGWYNGPGLGAGVISGPAIADGYLAAVNSADGQIYCFGKGKTATTVTVGPKTVANGSSVLIEGTILDQSPAQQGTPCVSAKSQGQWMEYLHMQKPCPTNTTGVPVKLEAFGSDGSYINIGTVTSDPYGNFKSAWTPPKQILYTIMATFAGDDSYWSSYAATGLNVGPAPAEPEPVEIPAYPDYTPLFAVLIVAAVIAIIIGIVILLRKK